VAFAVSAVLFGIGALAAVLLLPSRRRLEELRNPAPAASAAAPAASAAAPAASAATPATSTATAASPSLSDSLSAADGARAAGPR
jgi:hypothetical protein